MFLQEESSGDDKSLINYNYQPHAPQEPSTEPECPHSQKRKTVVKTEIPDSEDEDADDEADEEEFFYDDNGNVLWGNTIVVDASASD